MEKFIYYNELYLIYKDLLNKKNEEVFDLYYGDNLTMQEIADIKNISKARVGMIIKSTTEKLDDLEKALHVYENKESLKKLLDCNDLNKMKKEIENIIKGE